MLAVVSIKRHAAKPNVRHESHSLMLFAVAALFQHGFDHSIYVANAMTSHFQFFSGCLHLSYPFLYPQNF